MYYLSTCFQVRAYWLFNDEDTTARREGVVKAFASASRYIEHLNSGDKSSLPVRYLRFLDLRICFTAAIFLSKVIHSSYRNFVDEEHGKKVFSTAISFFSCGAFTRICLINRRRAHQGSHSSRDCCSASLMMDFGSGERNTRDNQATVLPIYHLR
jgi:hypothetical protein